MIQKFFKTITQSAKALKNFIPVYLSSPPQGLMKIDEALQILNFIDLSELTEEKVKKIAEKYIKINAPNKGGSFYLQNKIYHAQTTLLKALKFPELNKHKSFKKLSDDNIQIKH